MGLGQRVAGAQGMVGVVFCGGEGRFQLSNPVLLSGLAGDLHDG